MKPYLSFAYCVKWLSISLMLLIANTGSALAQSSDPNVKGFLTVHHMTQGQLLWLKGRVGDGYYVGLNAQGKTCSLKVPVAIGQYSKGSDLGFEPTDGIKVAVTSQALSDSILNGDPIRSDEWVISATHDPTEEVDGYIVSGISSDEGFALNAKRRWVSWLLEDKNKPVCQ
ncbi:hypothetical protein [Vibrio japonicus]|uniref:DUF1566 domain-containing protein n=1 Tax=Vibrio japonicus TaxID=1824638 RepID=A0ABY5LQA6_9VIBR|nr:hypothetical protein [Vibrio japonicus]UUM33036.1 hypothetical protein NP165_15925 [Vibrio japonicus]